MQRCNGNAATFSVLFIWQSPKNAVSLHSEKINNRREYAIQHRITGATRPAIGRPSV